MDEKVYKPATIEEQPFPGLTQTGFFNDSETTTSKSTYNPKTVQDRPIPQKIISHETIGQSLNTKSKKILQEFGFTESGAIAIGKFLQAISGDIRITPNGIVARDSSGNITFALDGDTGNATFAGELRSGSSITGRIQVGNNVVIDGEGDGSITVVDDNGVQSTVIDPLGIVSTNGFTIKAVSGSPTTAFTDTSYTDRVNLTPFTLERSVRALASLSIVGSSEQINGGLDCSGRTFYRIYSDVTGELVDFFYDSFITVATGIRENIISKTYSATRGITLGAGTHSLVLQSMIDTNTNFRSIMNKYNVSVVLLGV